MSDTHRHDDGTTRSTRMPDDDDDDLATLLQRREHARPNRAHLGPAHAARPHHRLRRAAPSPSQKFGPSILGDHGLQRRPPMPASAPPGVDFRAAAAVTARVRARRHDRRHRQARRRARTSTSPTTGGEHRQGHRPRHRPPSPSQQDVALADLPRAPPSLVRGETGCGRHRHRHLGRPRAARPARPRHTDASPAPDPDHPRRRTDAARTPRFPRAPRPRERLLAARPLGLRRFDRLDDSTAAADAAAATGRARRTVRASATSPPSATAWPQNGVTLARHAGDRRRGAACPAAHPARRPAVRMPTGAPPSSGPGGRRPSRRPARRCRPGDLRRGHRRACAQPATARAAQVVGRPRADRCDGRCAAFKSCLTDHDVDDPRRRRRGSHPRSLDPQSRRDGVKAAMDRCAPLLPSRHPRA